MVTFRKIVNVALFLAFFALVRNVLAEPWPTYLHDSGRSGVTDETLSVPLAPTWTYQSLHPLRPSWSESARHDFFHHRRGLREHVIFDRAMHTVSDGTRVYFGSTTDDTLRCLDATSGKELWRFPTAGPLRCPPVLHGDRLFIGSDDGSVYALSTESGKLIWTLPPRSPEKMIGNGRLISRWPVRTTVVVDGEIGYCAAGLFPTSEGVYFRKFQLDDGRLLSEEKLPQPAQGSPVLAGDCVTIPAGRVTPTMLAKKEQNWLADRLGSGRSDTFASSIESEGVSLVGNGCQGCLDAYSDKTHKRIGRFSGTRAVVSDDLIVIQSDESLRAISLKNYFAISEKMTNLRAKYDEQKRRGKPDEALAKECDTLQKQLDSQVMWTVPSQGRYTLIKTADMLFTGGENRVEAFSIENGKRLWSGEVVGRVYGLAVAEGRLLVSTNQGMIYAFEPQDGAQADETVAAAPKQANFTVSPSILSRTTDSAEIEWPDSYGDSCCLEYGLVGKDFSQKAQGTTVNHYRVAALTGLQQGAIYQARLVKSQEGQDDQRSETFYFRTELDPKLLKLPTVARSEPLKQAAEKILGMSSGQKGFCVVLYPDDARLAVELARTGQWHVILVAQTEEHATKIRDLFSQMNVEGAYVTVLHGPLEELGLPPYFADLVVGPSSKQLLESAGEVYRIVRPEGGRLLVASGTKDVPAEAKQVPDPFNTDGSATESTRLLAQRGPLPGSGTWKQGIGDPGQTAQSGDTRVHGPMRVLWFGEPGPRRMADRHHRNPSPLYADGRLFIPGDQIVFAVCSYSGTPLWHKTVPGSRRLGTFLDSSNLSVDGEHLYWAVKNQCLCMNVTDGKEDAAPLTLPEEDAEKRHWGYLASVDAEGGLVLGTAVEKRAAYDEMSRTGDLLLWYDNMSVVMGKSLFARNRNDGSLRWVYRNGAIINTTIAIGPKRVYFLESSSRQALDHPAGRVPMRYYHDGDCHLTALNLSDGSVAWRKKIDPSDYYHIAYLNYTDGKLLLSGNHCIDKAIWYFYSCYNAEDCKPLWEGSHKTKLRIDGGHGEYNRHPTIVGNHAYIWPYAFDLATGKRDPDFHFSRGGHGCGNIAASQGALFFRGGNPQQRDLAGGAAGPEKVNSVTRAGCWINMIPAGGLLMIPEASSGCFCAYPLQTSLAYVPDRDVSAKPEDAKK